MVQDLNVERYFSASIAALILGPLGFIAIYCAAVIAFCFVLIFPLFIIYAMGIANFLVLLLGPILPIYEKTIIINLVFSFLVLPSIHISLRSFPIIRDFTFPFLGGIAATAIGYLLYFDAAVAMFGGFSGLIAAYVFSMIMNDEL